MRDERVVEQDNDGDMANYLTPYVEFLGLPGCGKSHYSHLVAEKLREEGFQVVEPSWRLDNVNCRLIRFVRKTLMSLCFSIICSGKARALKKIINESGCSKREAKRFNRNLLYKAYLLIGHPKKVFFFDEGLAQIAVSLSVITGKVADQIYDEIKKTLSLRQECIMIRIVCNEEDALNNMEIRGSNDSYVERLSGVRAKIEYLSKYQSGCESIKSDKLQCVQYDTNGNHIVQDIVTVIKQQLQ